LLELARALLVQARQDESHPIPVVFSLSSWATRRSSLSEWLAAELHDRYQVPLPLATSWIQTDQVLPLLDGLDEVATPYRAGCVEAINTYRRTHGLLPTVVSSRQTDYRALSTRLLLRTAVVVQPLTPGQIESYLTSGGERLEALREMLSTDADLRALASTPLMLNVLTAAYQGTTRQEIDTTGSPRMKQEQVFASYVRRMLTHRSSSIRYRPEQTMHWLSSLARQMKRHNQTVFYIEHMQSSWLSGNRALKEYEWLAVLLPGILIGILVGLAVVTVFWEPTTSTYGLSMLLGGLLGGLFSSRSAPQLFAKNGGKAKSTAWRPFLQWLLIGVLFGIGVGLGFGLRHGLRVGLLSGLIFGLCGILIQVLLVKNNTMQSPIQTSLPDWKTKWQRLIRGPALRNALLVGLLIGLSSALYYELSSGLSSGLSSALYYGLLIGIISGFISWFLSLLLIGRNGTIQLADRLIWSWTSFGRSLWSSRLIRATLQIMVLIGLYYGLSNGLNSGKSGVLYPLIFGLSNGLGFGLGYWLLLGLFQGVSGETIEDQQRMFPNQGIRRSALNGFVFGLMSGIVGILGYLLGNELGYLPGYVRVYGREYGLIYLISGPFAVLIFGLSVGLIAGLLGGGLACERHHVLRILLWRGRAIPWNYARFLDFASESILLRKVGGGYIFLHRLLLDYFANLETETGSDGLAESSQQELQSVTMPSPSEEPMRVDASSHVAMVPSALIPVLSQTPHPRSAAFIWERGAISGVILGTILIIISLLPFGALTAIIDILVWLIGFFLIGLLAGRQSGRVGTGALIGLVTGLISGLIVGLLVVMLIIDRAIQITQDLIIGIVIGLIFTVALLLGLGGGIGALGALVGRRQTAPAITTPTDIKAPPALTLEPTVAASPPPQTLEPTVAASPPPQTPPSTARMQQSSGSSSSPRLFQLSGWALVVGSVIGIAQTFLDTSLLLSGTNLDNLWWKLDTLLFVAATILLLSGLPGLHVKQSNRAGLLGIIGIAIIFASSFGFIVLNLLLFPPTINFGQYDGLFNVSTLLSIIGYILLGTMIVRASVFPRWTGIVLILTSIVQVLTFTPVNTALNPTFYTIVNASANALPYWVAVAGCGYALLSRQKVLAV
jgi:hypothetical protein